MSDLLGRVSQHRQGECEDRDRGQQEGGERALGADAEVGRQEFRRLLAQPSRPNQAGVDAQGEQERAEDVQCVVVPRVSGQRSDRGVAEESADREGDQGPEGGPAAQQRGGPNDQKSRQKQRGRRSSAPGRGCRPPADSCPPRCRSLEPDPDSATERQCSRPPLRPAFSAGHRRSRRTRRGAMAAPRPAPPAPDGLAPPGGAASRERSTWPREGRPRVGSGNSNAATTAAAVARSLR